MVTEFGMGVALDAEGAPPIALPTGDYALSDRTRRDVDVAAMMLARDAHRRARALLAENRECLDDLAANALERETLSREDLDEIFAAHEPPAGASQSPLAAVAFRRLCASQAGEELLLPAGPLGRPHGARRPLGRPPLRPAGAADRRARAAHLHRHDAQHPGREQAVQAAGPDREDPGDRLPRHPRARPTGLLAGVHALHETIKGELPEDAGVHPAGTPYSAFDPELMLWTLAVIADSGRAMYETMVRPLSDGEREDLWQDYVRFGELFRLPRSEVPGSYREFEAWFEGKLASPDLHATEHALEMAPMVAFEQPVPAPARGNLAHPEPLHQGDRCRRGSGRSSGSAGARATERSFRAMAAAHRRARRSFPHTMRRGRNDYFFDLVIRTEQQRGGTVTPQLGPRSA